MEINNKKSVLDDLSVYDFTAKDNDWIEVTQWGNEEGFDVSIQNGDATKQFSLSIGELDAIGYLIGVLRFHKKD